VLTFELTEEEREAIARPPVLVPAYNPHPQGRAGSANWKAYQEYKSVERQKQLMLLV